MGRKQDWGMTSELRKMDIVRKAGR